MKDLLRAMGLEELEKIERGILGAVVKRARKGDLEAIGLLVAHLEQAREESKHKRIGRRSRFTPEVQDAFIDAIRNGASQKIACDLVGIGESTLYSWLREAEAQAELLSAEAVSQGREPDDYEVPERSHLAFRQRIARAKASLHQELLADVVRQSHQGNVRASTWLMERKFPQEYRDGVRQHEVRVALTGDRDLRDRMVLAGLIPADAPSDDIEDLDSEDG